MAKQTTQRIDPATAQVLRGGFKHGDVRVMKDGKVQPQRYQGVRIPPSSRSTRTRSR